MLLRYMYGDDVFISYARADAITYAAGLAVELANKGVSCFLDQWGTLPGQELPKSLKRSIKRSTVFVLVGTEKAATSHSVELEVVEFLKTKRTIVPIDFARSLEKAPWYSYIIGLAKSVEIQSALHLGEPSTAVVTRIEKSLTLTKRNQRVRRAYSLAATLLFILFCVTIYAGVDARQQRKEAAYAKKEALEQQQNALIARSEAEQAFKEAKNQEVIASANADKAVRQEAIAKENARKADEQATIALQNAEKARQQQEMAEKNQAIAFSRELTSNSIAQRSRDPELSTLLSIEAVNLSDTIQAEDALRLSLLELRSRIVMHGHTDSVNSAMFSPDGKLIVSASRDKYTRVVLMRFYPECRFSVT